MLEALLTIYCLVVIGFYWIVKYRWITISITPNSPIYSIVRSIRIPHTKYQTEVIDGMIVIRIDKCVIPFEYSREWSDAQVSIVDSKGEIIDLNLPPGCVFNMTAESLGVNRIIIHNRLTGSTKSFYGHDIPEISSEVEEL